MSYQSVEESVESGQPVELFRFANLEQRFLYTSGQRDVVFSAETYVPRPITRSEDRVESLNAQREITLKLPVTDPFVLRYIATVPSRADELKIYRFHTTDGGTPEVIQTFAGLVANVAITKNNEGVVNAQSYASLLNRQIPRQTCRSLCGHILYNARCKVDNTDFLLNGEIVAVSADGTLLTVDTETETVPFTGLQLSAQLTSDASFLLGGSLERSGLERRMIRSSTNLGGNQVQVGVLLPFSLDMLGRAVTLLAGCDHKLATCRDKFDNTVNYGGFPLVPKKNPFETGVDR